MMGPGDSYSIDATGAISGFASTPVSIEAGGGAAPPLVTQTLTPTPTPVYRFTSISVLLSVQFRHSCYPNSANVNTAAGEVAISECSIDGVEVTYTAFKSEEDLAASLNSLGDVTHPGACTPQGDDLGIIDNTQSFGYAGHSGTIFCIFQLEDGAWR